MIGLLAASEAEHRRFEFISEWIVCNEIQADLVLPYFRSVLRGSPSYHVNSHFYTTSSASHVVIQGL